MIGEERCIGIRMQDHTKPLRVLHVLGTTNLGGAESRIMELYRCIDREAVQFDFLVHTAQEGHYSKEILKLGGRIYHVPRFRGINIAAYCKAFQDFFLKHHEFAAVHGHMTSTAAIYLPIAKKSGIGITIAHARSAGVDKGVKGIVTRLLRLSLKNRTDYCFACSKEAAVAVFGNQWVKKKRVCIIPNAVDTERFRYNETIRNQVREELNLTDQFVLGHVGRFGFMKNHRFLIDIFAEFCKLRADAALVLIGKGELEEEIRKKVEHLGLRDKVHFLGNHYDIERYYQAFDYFVFPSVFEGLPGSVVEAQASGLRCLISDRVTREAALTDLTSYRSIEDPAAWWAQEIYENDGKALVRRDTSLEIAERGFDVKRQAVLMAEFYRTGKNPPSVGALSNGERD